jgi:hypothetical protein
LALKPARSGTVRRGYPQAPGEFDRIVIDGEQVLIGHLDGLENIGNRRQRRFHLIVGHRSNEWLQAFGDRSTSLSTSLSTLRRVNASVTCRLIISARGSERSAVRCWRVSHSRIAGVTTLRPT